MSKDNQKRRLRRKYGTSVLPGIDPNGVTKWSNFVFGMSEKEFGKRVIDFWVKPYSDCPEVDSEGGCKVWKYIMNQHRRRACLVFYSTPKGHNDLFKRMLDESTQRSKK